MQQVPALKELKIQHEDTQSDNHSTTFSVEQTQRYDQNIIGEGGCLKIYNKGDNTNC